MKLFIFIVILAGGFFIVLSFTRKNRKPRPVRKDAYICPVCNSRHCECQKENGENAGDQ